MLVANSVSFFISGNGVANRFQKLLKTAAEECRIVLDENADLP